MIVDIHAHVLPGIDDGPDTLEAAVHMCRLAASDGTDVIITTPHRFDGLHVDHDVAKLAGDLDVLRAALGPAPRLALGTEFRFTHDIADLVLGPARQLTLNGGPYVLLEMPSAAIPVNCENPIYRLSSAGLKVVVAHPERNREVQSRFERFFNLVELGLVVQIDAGSILGKFGPKAQAAARQMLEHRLVHVIASDGHSPVRRRPLLSAAVEAAREIVGDDVEALVGANPEAIFEGRPLPYLPDPVAPGQTRKRRFFFF